MADGLIIDDKAQKASSTNPELQRSLIQKIILKRPNFKNKTVFPLTLTDTDSSRKLREDFAKACFETLLQFSFITRAAAATEEGTITKLAVTALLQRCQDVLRRYVEDERLSGKCPLPR